MIGTIIGGVLTVGGALAGGIAGSNAAKRASNITRQQQRKNRNWYDYNMNTDYTQRADALASVNRAREIFMERNKNASATAAVTGATDEAAARAKEDANKVISDTMSNIAAQGAAHKDQVEAQYMQRDAELAEQQRQTEMAKAQAIAGAASQVTKVGANLAASDAIADASAVPAEQSQQASQVSPIAEVSDTAKDTVDKALSSAQSEALTPKTQGPGIKAKI